MPVCVRAPPPRAGEGAPPPDGPPAVRTWRVSVRAIIVYLVAFCLVLGEIFAHPRCIRLAEFAGPRAEATIVCPRGSDFRLQVRVMSITMPKPIGEHQLRVKDLDTGASLTYRVLLPGDAAAAGAITPAGSFGDGWERLALQPDARSEQTFANWFRRGKPLHLEVTASPEFPDGTSLWLVWRKTPMLQGNWVVVNGAEVRHEDALAPHEDPRR